MQTPPEIGEWVFHVPTSTKIKVERRSRLANGAVKLNGSYMLADCEPVIETPQGDRYPWGNLPTPRRNSIGGAAFSTGDRVTNNSGWHGVVTKIEEKPSNKEIGGDGFYYWVQWHERMEDPMLSRRPEIGHLAAQIRLFVTEVSHV